MSGKRRKYTPEFREQAARLVIETGRPVAHVAAEIGIGEQVPGRWVRLQRQAAAAGDTGAVLDADERAELASIFRAGLVGLIGACWPACGVDCRSWV